MDATNGHQVIGEAADAYTQHEVDSMEGGRMRVRKCLENETRIQKAAGRLRIEVIAGSPEADASVVPDRQIARNARTGRASNRTP